LEVLMCNANGFGRAIGSYGRLACLVGVFLSAAACSGRGSQGESCAHTGSTDDCKSGLVCGKPTDSATSFQCLITCKGDGDCPSGTSCKGVDGTDIKGCRGK
jgi:hypothetical protein